MNFPLHNIVVGSSLDPASDPVVRAALELKKKTGADLHLVHAYALPVVYGGGFYPSVDPIELLELQQTGRVEEQLGRLGAKKEDFAQIVALVGYPDRLIEEVADQVGADLVVIGASETPPRLQPFFGSTADRLLRRVHRPVLIVRGELGLEKIQEVLALTDLSELSEAVLSRGFGLLDHVVPAARAHALFVLSALDREGSAHFKPEQVDRFALEELTAFLGRLPRREAGSLDPVLRSGDPREEAAAYLAAHPEIGLLILGTHGRRGFERFLLGSVAAEVLRRVAVSALVVPPVRDEA